MKNLLSKLGSVAKFMISIFIPGGSFIFAGRYGAAFLVPLMALFWLFLFAYTRWVVSAYGFLTMLFGLLLIHLVSFLIGKRDKDRRSDVCSIRPQYAVLLCLILFNATVAIGSHLYKTKLYGFALYEIVSESMSPTLLIGDIVLVDSWFYANNFPRIGDIVVFEHAKTGVHHIKRVAAFPAYAKDATLNKKHLFVVGDNRWKSFDSRYHGAVTIDAIIGKTKAVLVSTGAWPMNGDFRFAISL